MLLRYISKRSIDHGRLFLNKDRTTRAFLSHFTHHTKNRAYSFRSARSYKFVIKPIVVLTALGVPIYLTDLYFFESVAVRSMRALYVMLWIAYQYSMNTSKYGNMRDLHDLSAEKLLNMLMENRGLYIKLGQAIANQGTLFPIEYQKKFRRLYDDAPVESWDKIDSILQKQYGRNYESTLFDTIEHDPVASASIAQVHRGRLKGNGEDVAIKVQHSYINKQISVDLFMYRLISRIYEKVFDLPLTMFTTFVSKQLVQEVDFVHEMQNSERLRKYISNDREMDLLNVYIPRTYPDITSKGILVTEWCDGLPLTSRKKLLEADIDIALTMTQYLKVFGRQIFAYGFVHSDPHPGNLLARYGKYGKQELVILDHGLYIDLPHDFRLDYCSLWKSIFLFDYNLIKKVALKWGVNSIDAFATFVLLRPFKSSKNSRSLQQEGINALLRNFLSDENAFPRELVFLTRTMRMIQNLNRTFGSPVNRINILTNELIDALRSDPGYSSMSTFKKASDYIEYIRVKLVLLISGAIFSLIRLKQKTLGNIFQSGDLGIEDYLEQYLVNTAKEVNIEILE